MERKDVVTCPRPCIFLELNKLYRMEDERVAVGGDFEVRLQGFPGKIQDMPYVDIKFSTVLREPPLIPCNLKSCIRIRSYQATLLRWILKYSLKFCCAVYLGCSHTIRLLLLDLHGDQVCNKI